MSKTKNFIFKGKQSFSSSKLDQIKHQFSNSNKIDAKISSNEIYLVQSKSEIINHEGLQDILAAKENDTEFAFYVGPRLGTISPWSSKTEDIIRNVGFDNIERVERLYGFNLECDSEINALDLSMFYDRMTQSIYNNKDDFKNLFKSDKPRSLNHINILEAGKSELERANKSFGFAMSNQEIDYLYDFYNKEKRNPTDAELMMFAQANSEHCRHKIFNAKWNVGGSQKNNTLFDLIKETSKSSPDGIISAYKDNAAIVEGSKVERLNLNESNEYEFKEDNLNSTIKVETHNHPTAISPYPGASTGSGGEIRDEGATGRGAKPKIGLVGFNVSNLRIPNLLRSWEKNELKPSRIASPLDIMIEAPIGAAAFNNEFGRPSTLGYFRCFETDFDNNKAFGYHKPIMLAGGIGEVRDVNNFKLQIKEDYLVVVLGGPAMLIGLGGGAASSVSSGDSDEDLDFASVQRDNAEMERRCQEVINKCSSQENSFIEFIHDVGAGGLSNAIPELAKDSNLGVYIELSKIPNADKSMSPMEIWSNESQERYVLAIHKDNKNAFEKICQRERCEYAIVGHTTKEMSVKLYDEQNKNYPVDVPLSMLFGDLPITEMEVKEEFFETFNEDNSEDIDLSDSITKVLQHPTVSSKSFLITIGDRTVSGMVARDQFVGPYQVPVSDYSLSLRSYTSNNGEVLSIGEKPTIALINPAASMRMALGEALTNMSGVVIKGLNNVQVSANWMAASGENSDDFALRSGVEALSKIAVDLKVSIPVGKDSLSMRTKWSENNSDYEVSSPLSGVITAMAPVDDVTESVTPELNTSDDTSILLIKLNNKNRLAGSIFSEITETKYQHTPDIDDIEVFEKLFSGIQNLLKNKKILAMHDISDGGLVTTLLEMCFTKKVGMRLDLDDLSGVNEFLFSEEIGFAIQIKKNNLDEITNTLTNENIYVKNIAEIIDGERFSIFKNDSELFSKSVIELEKNWRETSHAIQSIRDNEEIANSELSLLDDRNFQGLKSNISFDENELKHINIKRTKPKVAILREQGVNGQNEMAAAFTLAGFNAFDVHMQDLLDGNTNLKDFQGMAVCGGFSYGDVLGAGGGWSKTILYNNLVKDQFQEFFSDEKVFTLGVCNGCQMLSNLKDIVPGAEFWPSFERNLSDQFEARLAQVKISKTESVLLDGMEDWMIPVASAHGEGRAQFNNNDLQELEKSNQIAMHFVDSSENSSEIYPINPNGSPNGITGITASNGRVTIMMPHPERVFRKVQLSWHRKDWNEYSPWMQIFINAKKFSDKN
ncbi:phosphoribosylformylglycinamidine synthase [Gammaproteobacteria bacterium]|nr:phosphoribosylformylglycinamidine synthase [Gammaproteobacteria bacterium]